MLFNLRNPKELVRYAKIKVIIPLLDKLNQRDSDYSKQKNH